MGLSIWERIALSAIRGFLNAQIGRFTPPELQQAINENRDLWAVTPGWMKNAGSVFKGRYADYFKKYFDEKVDTPLILSWLSRDQFALFCVIQPDPFGQPKSKEYQWLDNQVKKMKEEIKRL